MVGHPQYAVLERSRTGVFMLERELKFLVPAASREGIAACFALEAERDHLRAQYFDTPDRRLARARAAIRLRLERGQWVQTLKMAGADPMTRIELNHACPAQRLDLSVYQGTPAEPVVAGLAGELGVRYETDVRRCTRTERIAEGEVELAYDVGVIRAGGLELPLCELEFELTSGRPFALFSVAGDWLMRYGLVLDLRSKAERGDALADAAARIEAAARGERDAVCESKSVRFSAPRLAARIRPHSTATGSLAATAAECIEHIARNAAVLAGDPAALSVTAPAKENGGHAHQLGAGLRRLCAAWRLCPQAGGLPPLEVREAARRYAALLKHRCGPDTPACRLAGSVEFQAWLLELLAWSVGERVAWR